MSGPIVLLTDFGHLDPYLGQMKGAILNHAPGVQIVDLCHEIQPHNIGQAEFMLQSSHLFFPAGSIFVNVVDPGVGTQRDMLLACCDNRFYLAPDNGLLSFLTAEPSSWWRIDKRPAASRTFHGRDVLAPVAALLAQGADPQTFASPKSVADVCRSTTSATTITYAIVTCRVLHVDRFGNCLLDLPARHASELCGMWQLASGQLVHTVTTYAELLPGQIGLLAGSQGVMELALNQASCAHMLALAPGAKLVLTRLAETV